MPIHPQWVTTAFGFDGYRITSHRGVVRGITVRSRSVVGKELCERAREEAFELMLRHASDLGANAVIGARYDANEIAAGVTEVLAYGTAVVVEPSGV